MDDKEYTVEELLEFVEGTSEPLSKSLSPPKKVELHWTVTDFLASKGVTSGFVRVPFFRIVVEYYRWNRKVSPDKLSPIALGRELNKVFEQKRSGKEGRVYLLNECFDMSEEENKKARTFYYKKFKQMRKTKWSKMSREKPKVGRSRDVPGKNTAH